MATARWTFFSICSVMVVGAAGQLALIACGTGPIEGFPGVDASSSASGSGSSDDSGVITGSDVGTVGSSGDPASSGSGTSGAAPSSGASSGQSASGSMDASSTYVVNKCGSTPCDLRSKTCCLPSDGGLDASYCVPGNQTMCGANVVTYHCLSSPDCPTSGNVCCGTYDLAAKTAATVCQTSCTGPQFCKADSECHGGVTCVTQSCMGISPLHLCGLQTQAPYNCTAQ